MGSKMLAGSSRGPACKVARAGGTALEPLGKAPRRGAYGAGWTQGRARAVGWRRMLVEPVSTMAVCSGGGQLLASKALLGILEQKFVIKVTKF